jgi:anti-repressor protein
MMSMNNLTVFENNAFGSVRVIAREGQPWFVAKDVSDCLEIGNTTEALRGLDDDEKFTLSNPEGNPRAGIPLEMNIISEPGLYSLILRSRKPEAKAFKRWITHEVIPSIRRHGMYATPQTVEAMLDVPDTTIKILTALKEERAQRQALEARAEADRPKVVFAESIEVAKTSILVGEMAKLIKQATGHDVGQNRFFDWLRDNGYLHKSGSQRNMPTQRSIEAGWMEIKEGARIGSSGECHMTRTTKITGRGQIYFVNLFSTRNRAA